MDLDFLLDYRRSGCSVNAGNDMTSVGDDEGGGSLAYGERCGQLWIVGDVNFPVCDSRVVVLCSSSENPPHGVAVRTIGS